MVGVVEVGAVEAMGGALVQGGRLCFFGLPLPYPEPEDPHLDINDPYNMCIN